MTWPTQSIVQTIGDGWYEILIAFAFTAVGASVLVAVIVVGFALERLTRPCTKPGTRGFQIFEHRDE